MKTLTPVKIISKSTGIVLCECLAQSVREAIGILARDAGYKDYAELATAIGKTQEAAIGELYFEWEE